jgi:hypothetical protein
MATILDIIESVNPSDSATGVPLNSNITILFDREIDEWSLQHGGIIVEGPDTDQVIYPGYIPTTLVEGTEAEILQSPGYKGLVPGEFIFSRVALTTLSGVSTIDTTGDGGLFRTKVVFKPLQPLKGLTSYKVYVVGDDDETTDEIYGVRTRTVFDGVADPGNTGTGSLVFSGTYLGDLSNDTIHIRITSSGVAGVAEFEAWQASDVLDLIGPMTTSTSELQVLVGVTVRFIEGNFATGDEFSVKLKRPSKFTNTATFSFNTGNGSINVVPTTTATSPTGDPLFTPPSTGFRVVKISPADHATNLDPSKARKIVVEFSEDIDPATINAETVQVNIEPVIDHPSLAVKVPTGPISSTLTVSGNKLYIDL